MGHLLQRGRSWGRVRFASMVVWGEGWWRIGMGTPLISRFRTVTAFQAIPVFRTAYSSKRSCYRASPLRTVHRTDQNKTLALQAAPFMTSDSFPTRGKPGTARGVHLPLWASCPNGKVLRGFWGLEDFFYYSLLTKQNHRLSRWFALCL